MFARLSASFAAAALLAFASPAWANTLMGSAAQPADPSKVSCLKLTYSKVTNVCTSDVEVSVPLPTGSYGYQYPTVVVRSPLGSVCCHAEAYTSEGVAFDFGDPDFPDVCAVAGLGDARQVLTLKRVELPYHGGLSVHCKLKQNGTLNVVRW